MVDKKIIHEPLQLATGTALKYPYSAFCCLRFIVLLSASIYDNSFKMTIIISELIAGYCVDESPNKVCEIPDTQLHHITDERHGKTST